MIILKFLDQNVFNVLKYVFMTLTVSYAADILLDALHAYRTAKNLKDKGWAKPISSRHGFRLRRNLSFTRSGGSAIVVLCAILVTILEITVEFSTGAEVVWIENGIRIRVANQAASLEDLLKTDPRYIFRLKGALQRVENTCFDIERKWYHPVIMNLSSTSDFEALGGAAKCFQNYSKPIDARPMISEARFNASEFTRMKFWPRNETRVGRDVEYIEVVNALNSTDVTIGANEYYSFLAVNFSDPQIVEGSERRLTDHVMYTRTSEALYTLKYTVPNGEQIECLAKQKSKKRKKKSYILEVCLLPLSENRTVVGLFDDYEGTDDHQLVMSVAFEGKRSFHDLNILKAMPWMLGTNNGMHTYREIAVLMVLCGLMLEGVGTDGFHELNALTGVENTTAPTLSVWGIVLLSVGTVALLLGSVVLRKLKSGIPIQGDLATAEGVALHWLAQLNGICDSSRTEKPIFSIEHRVKDQFYITVKGAEYIHASAEATFHSGRTHENCN